MNPEQRKKLNEERLLFVSPSIRAKVLKTIQDMEAEGFSPLIAKDIWRTPQRQLELFKQGRSKARWAFHCATTPDGKPDSLAADIVDADLAWEAKQNFWLALGKHYLRNGLNWGGFWGLKEPQKTALLTRMAVVLVEPNTESVKIAFGWDVAHGEVKGVTILEAKAGKRPQK